MEYLTKHLVFETRQIQFMIFPRAFSFPQVKHTYPYMFNITIPPRQMPIR